MKEETNRIWEFIGFSAAKLAAIEIGLGGLLHSFHVPLSGHFLSLNQIFLLSRANRQIKSEEHLRTIPTQISFITSCLKSLSPAGKKLGPMLAISAQGFLFNLGNIFFGINILGDLLGAIFSSLWAFIQPVLLYLLIYQKDLKDIYLYYLNTLAKFIHLDANVLEKKLFIILALLILVKIILAIIVVIMSFKLAETKIEKYEKKMLLNFKTASPQKKRNIKNVWIAAARDLLSPLFILSIFFTFIFFIYAEHSHSRSIWIILRPITFAYFIFLLLRIAPVENWALNINKNKNSRGLQKSLASALIKIRQIK